MWLFRILDRHTGVRHIRGFQQQGKGRCRRDKNLLPILCLTGQGLQAFRTDAVFRTLRAGFPDLILLIPNRFYPFCGIELKAKTGRQSENQKAYQKEFESIGAKYVVVRSLDEFIKVVDNYLKDI